MSQTPTFTENQGLKNYEVPALEFEDRFNFSSLWSQYVKYLNVL